MTGRLLRSLAVALLAAGALTACDRVARVLVRHGGSGGAGGQAGPLAAFAPQQRWTPYADPAEHAFTVDVPAGWSVQGGLQRLAAVDVRTGVQMRSPDGKIELFYGDTEIPTFSLPNAMLAMAGFRVGSSYPLGQGVVTVVEPFMPGQQFARSWGAHRVSKACGQVAPQGGRPLPDLARTIDMAYAQGGVQLTSTAGDALFACVLPSGAPAQGYVFANTMRAQTTGNGIWAVPTVTGFIAAADRVDEARRLLAHVTASMQVDPAWAARQQNATMNVSRVVAQTNNAISDMIMGAWETKNAAQDRAMAADAQARRGVVTVDDGMGGRTQRDNSFAHHWRGPDGAMIDSNSAYPPVPGARELPVVPPR